MKKLLKTGIVMLAIIFSNSTNSQSLKTKKMEKKILFVVTSHAEKGNTGEKTGFTSAGFIELSILSLYFASSQNNLLIASSRFNPSTGGVPPFGETKSIS